MRRLILESIRTWIGSCQSMNVMVQIERRWIDVAALCAFPFFEEFLAIIFFERQRNIRIARAMEADKPTADEKTLLDSLALARWDREAAARGLDGFLTQASARAAARAAAKLGEVLIAPASLQIYLAGASAGQP